MIRAIESPSNEEPNIGFLIVDYVRQRSGRKLDFDTKKPQAKYLGMKDTFSTDAMDTLQSTKATSPDRFLIPNEAYKYLDKFETLVSSLLVYGFSHVEIAGLCLVDVRAIRKTIGEIKKKIALAIKEK